MSDSCEPDADPLGKLMVTEMPLPDGTEMLYQSWGSKVSEIHPDND